MSIFDVECTNECEARLPNFINTENAIRDGLIQCLQKKALSNISITDILRETGIARETFKNHYSDVSALFHALEKSFVRSFEAIFEKTTNGIDYETIFEKIVRRVSEDDTLRLIVTNDSLRNAFFESICRTVMGNVGDSVLRHAEFADAFVVMDAVQFVCAGCLSMIDSLLKHADYHTRELTVRLMTDFTKSVFASIN